MDPWQDTRRMWYLTAKNASSSKEHLAVEESRDAGCQYVDYCPANDLVDFECDR